jgi:hypothetical protein
MLDFALLGQLLPMKAVGGRNGAGPLFRAGEPPAGL